MRTSRALVTRVDSCQPGRSALEESFHAEPVRVGFVPSEQFPLRLAVRHNRPRERLASPDGAHKARRRFDKRRGSWRLARHAQKEATDQFTFEYWPGAPITVHRARRPPAGETLLSSRRE